MILDDFVAKYNNKKVDLDSFPKDNPFQCMDLYRAYVKECLSFPQSPSVAGAKDIWDTYLTSYYTRYNNSPTAVPKKGDIVIWGTKFGPYGHVAVFLDGGVTKFNSFDQNSPEGAPCHIQSHTYTGVLGWLRPKETQPIDSVPKWFVTLLQERNLTLDNESEIRNLFEKAKKYDDEVLQLQEQLKSANENLADKSYEVSELLGKNQSLTSSVTELEKLYNTAKSERDTFSWENDKIKIQVEELQKGIGDRDKQIEGLKIDYKSLQDVSTEALTVYQLLTIAIRKIFKK